MFDATAFYEALRRYDHIVIAGHVNPDGDSVGACLAMALFCAALGKKPTVLLEAYPPQYDVVDGREFIRQGEWYDVPCDMFIALDCGGKDRLDRAIPVFDRAALTVNIDHHKSNPGFAMMNAVDRKKSSASELLYTILQPLAPMDVHVASALMAGVVFDTGGFRHPSTSPETHEIAAALMRLGANASVIRQKMLHTHTMPATKIFSTALAHTAFSAVAPIVYTFLTLADMENADAMPHDLDGIVEHILDVDGAEAAILVSERGGGLCKISLRSRGLDMHTIAARFGGGGHKNAAGASAAGTAETVLATVCAECEKDWGKYAIQNDGH